MVFSSIASFANYTTSSIGSIFYSRPSLDRDAKYCHGTNFSTLHMMCTQDNGYFRPLPQLKRPPFSGELRRGIMVNGVNHKGSSWAAVTNAGVSISYSAKYPFNPAEIKAELLFGAEPYFGSPGNAHTYETHFFWNRTRVLIQQFRAWDDKEFQRDVAPVLKKWIADLKVYHDSEDCDLRHDGRQLSSDQMKALIRVKCEAILEAIQSPLTFALDEESKKVILEGPPIVFITTAWADEHMRGDEVSFQRPLKLGLDIPWIATTDTKYVEDYFKAQKLANRVHVIAMDALRGLIRD